MTQRFAPTTGATGVLLGVLLMGTAAPASAQQKIDLKELGKEALKGVAIGYAVKQSAKPLNQFINTITLRSGLADKQTTKVVPMLSLGDKGYIGAAQVSGPASLIAQTQAVWQGEGSKQIGDGMYRVKALVPSNSLNPLKIRRVQKVGVTAVIDVATGGPLNREGPYSRPLRAGDLIKAGTVAVAVNAAAKPLNDFVNAITLNRSALATKVVPMATFGEKAYVGAGQLSGSTATLGQAKTLWQYEDLFDRGRFRVKILIPTNGVNPKGLRRISGVGLSALIDTSIQRQAAQLEPRRGSNSGGNNNGGGMVPISAPGSGGRGNDGGGGGFVEQSSGSGAPNRSAPPGWVWVRNERGEWVSMPRGQAKKRGLIPHDNGNHNGSNKDKGRSEDNGQDRGKGKKNKD